MKIGKPLIAASHHLGTGHHSSETDKPIDVRLGLHIRNSVAHHHHAFGKHGIQPFADHPVLTGIPESEYLRGYTYELIAAF